MASTWARALSRPVAGALGGLASVRHARAFHPVGTTVRATATIEADPAHPLVGLSGRHDAVIRTSRGVGLPAALPDVHGVAIRLLHPSGDLDAGVLDLPLASAGEGRLLRHVLRPGRDPQRPTYSSLAPYADAAGERFVIGARFAGPDALDLLVAAPGGPWRVVGSVVLGEPVDGEGLRFDPFTCPPGITPVGALNDLRRPAYRASQAHRPTDGPSAVSAGRGGRRARTGRSRGSGPT